MAYKTRKKKVKKNVPEGIAHIHSTFNNTIVTISDDAGNKERRKLLIFTNQYLELGLRKGMILDEDTFDALEKCSRECLAIRKGSDLLSYSASSKVRLVQRMRSKGIDKESAIGAAEHLEKMGLIYGERKAFRRWKWERCGRSWG